jgi:hypothetical protein
VKITEAHGNEIVKLDGLTARVGNSLIPVTLDGTKTDYYGAMFFVDVQPDHEFEVVGYAEPVPEPVEREPTPSLKRRSLWRRFLFGLFGISSSM